MIRHIRGEVVDADVASIVVDVNGVGYHVNTCTPNQSYAAGETVSLFVYLSVRETALELYGFANKEALEIFELLIGQPKIGPKAAAQILAQADIQLLKEAVSNNDPSYLSKMSGIGKKSAEKIVTGLTDAFETKGYLDGISTLAGDVGTDAAFVADTIDALVTLGYPQADARKAVQQLQTEHPDVTSSAEAVKLALKKLHV